MLFVFKYLFCTVHLHIIHITVRKFNNEYVSSCQLCKMGGMVELKGNVIGKHTSAHFIRSTVIDKTTHALFIQHYISLAC